MAESKVDLGTCKRCGANLQLVRVNHVSAVDVPARGGRSYRNRAVNLRAHNERTWTMANTVETREYIDGTRILRAQILDNGCVQFAAFVQGDMIPPDDVTRSGAVSSEVLRQLADLADRANVSGR